MRRSSNLCEHNLREIKPRSTRCSSGFKIILEQLDGHMGEIGREFRQQADLDIGPILAFDDFLRHTIRPHMSTTTFSRTSWLSWSF